MNGNNLQMRGFFGNLLKLATPYDLDPAEVANYFNVYDANNITSKQWDAYNKVKNLGYQNLNQPVLLTERTHRPIINEEVMQFYGLKNPADLHPEHLEYYKENLQRGNISEHNMHPSFAQLAPDPAVRQRAYSAHLPVPTTEEEAKEIYDYVNNDQMLRQEQGNIKSTNRMIAEKYPETHRQIHPDPTFRNVPTQTPNLAESATQNIPKIEPKVTQTVAQEVAQKAPQVATQIAQKAPSKTWSPLKKGLVGGGLAVGIPALAYGGYKGYQYLTDQNKPKTAADNILKSYDPTDDVRKQLEKDNTHLQQLFNHKVNKAETILSGEMGQKKIASAFQLNSFVDELFKIAVKKKTGGLRLLWKRS